MIRATTAEDEQLLVGNDDPRNIERPHSERAVVHERLRSVDDVGHLLQEDAESDGCDDGDEGPLPLQAREDEARERGSHGGHQNGNQGKREGKGKGKARDQCGDEDVGRKGDEFTGGKVDDAHGVPDEHVTKGHESIDGSHRGTARDHLSQHRSTLVFVG